MAAVDRRLGELPGRGHYQDVRPVGDFTVRVLLLKIQCLLEVQLPYEPSVCWTVCLYTLIGQEATLPCLKMDQTHSLILV